MIPISPGIAYMQQLSNRLSFNPRANRKSQFIGILEFLANDWHEISLRAAVGVIVRWRFVKSEKTIAPEDISISLPCEISTP